MSESDPAIPAPGGGRWAAEVRRLMIEVSKEYPNASPERQRELAGVALAQLCLATADIGIFEGEAAPAQDALLNLLMMIRDLEAGRRHPWAIPVSVGGTSWERQVDREVRLWAITFAKLQRAAGIGTVSAYRAVAAELNAVGYPATANGVKTWCTRHVRSPRKGDEERIAETFGSFRPTEDPASRLAAYSVESRQVLVELIERFQP